MSEPNLFHSRKEIIFEKTMFQFIKVKKNMAACSDIKKIGLELDKEFNAVLEKNYRIK